MHDYSLPPYLMKRICKCDELATRSNNVYLSKILFFPPSCGSFQVDIPLDFDDMCQTCDHFVNAGFFFVNDNNPYMVV